MRIEEHYLYNTWRGMRHRCISPNWTGYEHYGGRGITVHPEWHDSRVFLEWVDTHLGQRPEGCTLDRIDNDGNYEPGNLRWLSRSGQQHNCRPNKQRPNTTDNIRYNFDNQQRLWKATIHVKNKVVFLGCHRDRLQCVLNSHLKWWELYGSV